MHRQSQAKISRTKKGKKDKKGSKNKHKEDNSSKSPRDSKKIAGASTPQQQRQAPMAAVQGQADSPVSFFVGDTRLMLTHAKLLDDTTFSDLVFSFPKQKKQTVHAHRVIVSNRIPSILAANKFVTKLQFKKGKYETNVVEATLPFMSPKVLQWILKFAYCGVLNISLLPVADLLNLTATATTLGINDLKWQCEHAIRALLTGDSVHVILKGADDRNLEDVKRIALAFSFGNWDSFIGNKQGAKILGLELFQGVSATYSKGEKVEDVEESEPENEILADYRRIYETMPDADLAITAGAEKIKCHRAILAMYSGALAATLKGIKIDPKSPQLFQLSDTLQSAQAVDSLLRFVYYGEASMDPLDAAEMITKVNSRFKLNTFELLCEHTIINGINVKSAVSTLGVTYIQPLDEKPHIKALRQQTVAYIIGHFGSVNLEPLKALPPIIQTDLLFELQATVKKGTFAQGARDRSVSASGQSVSESSRASSPRKSDEAPMLEVAAPPPTLTEAAGDGEVVVGASEDDEEGADDEQVTTV